MARRAVKPVQLLAIAAVVVVGWLANQSGLDLRDSRGADAPVARSADRDHSIRRIESAVANRKSDFIVTVDASVRKVLRDDLEGSRHQRFLIELDNGRSLLVAHNIDLAGRVSLRVNDRVRIRGEYEWNERGGVLHWTHHDPQGRHPGGWIEHAGRRIE